MIKHFQKQTYKKQVSANGNLLFVAKKNLISCITN